MVQLPIIQFRTHIALRFYESSANIRSAESFLRFLSGLVVCTSLIRMKPDSVSSVHIEFVSKSLNVPNG